jgi:hypothetical protein
MAESNSVQLTKDANLSSEEPHSFPPFPGVYQPGVPVSLELIGLSGDEAQALIDELGVPLELTSKKAPAVELPIAGRHHGELAPGEDVPILPPAAPIHSSPEGWEPPPDVLAAEAETVVTPPEPEPEAEG